MQVTRMTTLLLKVLNKNMQSCHGGELQWKIGKTYTVKGEIIICQNGLHLTADPKLWMRNVRGARVFIAETDKIYAREGSEKTVCKKVKLLKELTHEELTEYGAKRQPIDAEYRAKRQTIYAEYGAKCQTIYAEYEAKRQTIYAEYRAKRQTIDAEYEAKSQTIYAEYRAKRQTIDAEYEAKITKILRAML